MTHSHRSYVPAAGKRWRLPFYDLVTKVMGAGRVRAVLVEQAACGPDDRVLEIGCGTGSLLLQVKRTEPGTDVVGLDPDPAALAIARRKAERAGITLRLDEGFADELPYPDASFDRVLSCLMFHHLPRDVKTNTLREVRRVLKPGARFHMVDFAGPGAGGRGFLARRIHGDRALADNEEDRVLGMMRDAGLADPQVAGRRGSHVGLVLYYQAAAPASSPS